MRFRAFLMSEIIAFSLVARKIARCFFGVQEHTPLYCSWFPIIFFDKRLTKKAIKMIPIAVGKRKFKVLFPKTF